WSVLYLYLLRGRTRGRSAVDPQGSRSMPTEGRFFARQGVGTGRPGFLPTSERRRRLVDPSTFGDILDSSPQRPPTGQPPYLLWKVEMDRPWWKHPEALVLWDKMKAGGSPVSQAPSKEALADWLDNHGYHGEADGFRALTPPRHLESMP